MIFKKNNLYYKINYQDFIILQKKWQKKVNIVGICCFVLGVGLGLIIKLIF